MGSAGQGQVFADTCLICSQQCFVQSHITKLEAENKLTASRKKRSNSEPTAMEIRQSLYKAFNVAVKPEDVSNAANVKGITYDLPLCFSCTFKVGQLRVIQTEMAHLEKQYERMREEIAFSIVDVVASSLNNSICTNIGDQPPGIILRKLQEYEAGTLQQIVFEKWHEASYTDFACSETEEFAAEQPSSSQQGSKPNGRSHSNTRLECRKLSSSSGMTVTSSDIVADGNPNKSSISITKVDLGRPTLAYENGQLQILDVDEEEDSRFPADIYCDEEPESPPGPEEPFEDDDFETEGLDENDLLSLPFGLELAEYSSAIKKEGFYDDGEEEVDDLDIDAEQKQLTANDPHQNLEIFRDREGLYECQFCQKKFIHKYPFRDHLRVHFGDGPRCKICNKIFPKKHNLMLHLRTHSGEKPYVCTVCEKGFADKSNLKVHMRVHTGERPYKCEYCNVAFSNSSRLVVHKRTHTGEKPFTCDICNRRCTTRNQLSTHRKTHFQTGRNRHMVTKQ